MAQHANFLRFSNGHQHGQYGIEIWFDLELPFAWDKFGKPFFFKPLFFQVVHSDPRRMLLRCDAQIWSFWILALHAPHSGHPHRTREEWWQETSDILEKSIDAEAFFVLADANAAPGDFDGRTVQSHGFSTTANTPAFRSILRMYELFLPATTNIHQGGMHTWTHRDGLYQHCIDHVAVPLRLQSWRTHSQVVEDLDLATNHEDHKLVALQMQWHAFLSLPSKPSRPYEEKGRQILPSSWPTSAASQLQASTVAAGC